MTEKYIYCPSCKTLTIHNRLTGDLKGWLCQECNPPLEDFDPLFRNINELRW
jgi:ribosomal protein L37AE/L43A